MKNLAKVIGFEDSNKGGRDFAIVMQAAIGLTFLDGEEDVLDTLAQKFVKPGLQARLKRPIRDTM